MAAFWICLCAYLNCAGWILSALHALNPTGYIVTLLLGLGIFSWWRVRQGEKICPRVRADRMCRRFGRGFPRAFLILGTLAFLGGALHGPSNFDGLAYREPRVLHWLAEGQWHWIHTDFQRLNVRTAGFEWVTAPLFALTQTDRCVFLINMISFALLPGLVFGVFTQVGVRRRVAWNWMWLLPTGYCFLLQAGSIANDLFGAVFPLAALYFALRARKSGRMREVCLSILAAALMTSAKASMLPLLLPWLIAFLAAWRVWLVRPLALGALSLPAFGASFFPTAILNWKYCGEWSGRVAEAVGIGGGPAWLYVLNNWIMIFLENFSPPIFPLAARWNQLTPSLIPDALAPKLKQFFEPSAAAWQLGELRTEETSGVGFGVAILLALSLVAVTLNWLRKPRRVASAPPDWIARAVWISAWVSLLVSLANLGLSGVARYCAPYYAPAIMGLLLGAGHADVVRRKWWRGWAWTAMALAAMMLIISQARPLWPARWALGQLGPELRGRKLVGRIVTVYEVYGDRADAFGPMRKKIPAAAAPLGLVTFDDPEASLWRPFGSRRILHVRAGETAASVRGRGINYVLVNQQKLGEPFEPWLQRMNGRLLETQELKLRAGKPPFVWHLVALNPIDAAPEESSANTPATKPK